jgi:hypothetical protein
MRTEAEIAADARPGRAFSNGTEFDIWADRYCYECVHDNPNADPEVFCPILGFSLLNDATPREWVPGTVTTKYGSYEAIDSCTEFEQRRDGRGGDPDSPPPPDPAPECDGQLDLVDAYLPTALDELLKAPVTS